MFTGNVTVDLTFVDAANNYVYNNVRLVINLTITAKRELQISSGGAANNTIQQQTSHMADFVAPAYGISFKGGETLSGTQT